MIVLAHPGSGAGDLRRLLARSENLCCTSGTGLLPLCEVAAASWRRIDGRDGALTPLALASIRAIAGPLMSATQATLGGSRWCEIAFSPPEGADMFLQLFPAARERGDGRGRAGRESRGKGREHDARDSPWMRQDASPHHLSTGAARTVAAISAFLDLRRWRCVVRRALPGLSAVDAGVRL